MNELIGCSRPVTPRLLWLAVAAVGGTTVLINQWFFPSGAWVPISTLTGGWLNATLQAGWIVLVVVAGLVIMGVGRLRLPEFGLEASRLAAGALYAGVVWLMLNGAYAVAASPSVQLHPSWLVPGARETLSEFLGQIVGNALAEEVVYRGFFLTQGLWLFRRRWERRLWVWALLAILFSAAIFSVSHVPNRLWKGRYDSILATLADQARLMFGGAIFGWLYLRTRNLFFVVGVHALVNRPTLVPALAETAIPPAPVVYGLGVMFALVWEKLPQPSRRARHSP